MKVICKLQLAGILPVKTFSYEIDLPFPPFQGLRLRRQDWEFLVESVAYNADDDAQFYICTETHRQMTYARREMSDKLFEEKLARVTAYYRSVGWKEDKR